MSATLQNGALQSQLDLALNPEWSKTIPAGTTTAAPQVMNKGTGVLPGGGSQIYIPEVDSSWFHN